MPSSSAVLSRSVVSRQLWSSSPSASRKTPMTMLVLPTSIANSMNGSGRDNALALQISEPSHLAGDDALRAGGRPHQQRAAVVDAGSGAATHAVDSCPLHRRTDRGR